jgi:hypothetical protein
MYSLTHALFGTGVLATKSAAAHSVMEQRTIGAAKELILRQNPSKLLQFGEKGNTMRQNVEWRSAP